MADEILQVSPTAEVFGEELLAVLDLHGGKLFTKLELMEIQHIINIIKEPPSSRRNRQLARMELRAARFLHKEVGEVKWPAITLDEWLGIIKMLISILSILLIV